MNTYTHKLITEQAINDIILEIGGTELINESPKQIIIKGALAPDEDETDGTFKYHFYNPATRKNFKGERISALTQCITHFGYALELYSINLKKSLDELGRAVHYIEDLNTPVHTFYEDTFDAVTKAPLHLYFEEQCEKELKTLEFPKHEVITNYSLGLAITALKDVCKYSAMQANLNFKQWQDKSITLSECCESSLRLCYVNAKGVILKYLMKVGII